ncbi:hypothetical protein E1301_Tti014775 [Triplophysa tibetana]|uniref:Uncharacterized protein n=1 Tax=Triplophysa tibetana TaxID=1572043 RepID=A0A5A9NGM1_9TELE|nr:hypothetical protein E1301_Tti014775 [Triplophysa tibetana]
MGNLYVFGCLLNLRPSSLFCSGYDSQTYISQVCRAGPRIAPGLKPMGPDEPAEPQCLLFWCRTLPFPCLSYPCPLSLSLNVMDSVTLRLNKSPCLRCLLGFLKTGRHGYMKGYASSSSHRRFVSPCLFRELHRISEGSFYFLRKWISKQEVAFTVVSKTAFPYATRLCQGK